jgi:hypothetical protein
MDPIGASCGPRSERSGWKPILTQNDLGVGSPATILNPGACPVDNQRVVLTGVYLEKAGRPGARHWVAVWRSRSVVRYRRLPLDVDETTRRDAMHYAIAHPPVPCWMLADPFCGYRGLRAPSRRRRLIAL